MNIFCADIGGTHSRFAHFIFENARLYLNSQHTLKTAELCACKNTEEVLALGLSVLNLTLHEVDFQVWGSAGLLNQDDFLSVKLTNVPLHLNFSTLSWLKLHENFILVNDFALQAFASLAEEVSKWTLFSDSTENVKSKEQALRVILGAGTGLGAAYLVSCAKNHWLTLATECGHTDMAFYGQEEQEFAFFAQKYLKQERISAEDILSGRGLQLLHSYIHGKEVSPKEAAATMLCPSDNNDESIQLRLYARFLGRFCRHVALNTLCTGGIYLGGGVLMKNPDILKSTHFCNEFYLAPQSMHAILKKIPMNLMQHEHASLWGAAYLAKQYIHK